MKLKNNSQILPLFAPLLSLSLSLLGQEVSTDVSNYAAEEEIIVTFSDGPSNPKDWVGLFKQEMVTSVDSSLAWAYVDGTETGIEGLAEGDLTFADGMTDEGIYEARFFEDNGFTLLAKAVFTVGDVGPTAKTEKAVYTPGEPIVVDFLVGPCTTRTGSAYTKWGWCRVTAAVWPGFMSMEPKTAMREWSLARSLLKVG